MYCYVTEDGDRFESPTHGLPYRRDYRAERVGSNLESLRSSITANEEYKLYLPQRKELEEHMAPKAADAYIKDWNDHHESRDPRGDKYRPR